jgi:hypothetical protein
MDEDWLVRLRVKLGIVPKLVPQISAEAKPKPPEPDPPLASSSTGSVAGSFERIEVYRRRAANGESVFHPLDCKTIQAENTRCQKCGTTA